MDLGFPELIIILVIILLIFGPGRIVKVARDLGAGIRQFRKGLETRQESNRPEEKQSNDD